MKNIYYTDEKNTQIVLDLLKAHGIRKVIASPGATNIRLVASMQHDEWFEMYSAVDERSAAYIACGMAAETGEPVVLSCTGATASRNYFPGLTEAFYRKLPVLAITSTQHMGRVGQNIAQVLDRSVLPKDIVKLSVQLRTCHTIEDEWVCNVQANRAINELVRNGGGPAHIDLETTYSNDFSVQRLPEVYPVYRVGYEDVFPELPDGNIGIFVGAHLYWSKKLTDTVDFFCMQHNAVVLCDHTSNYHGKYRVLFSLVTSQDKYIAPCNNFELLIHIGNISGAYPYFESKAEWRVNPDGEIRDTFQHLKYVFEMEECFFFNQYIIPKKVCKGNELLELWKSEEKKIREAMRELPFSNIWVAKYTSGRLQGNSILHLGILNSLRSWNFFEISSSIEVSCNTGGFGIDGILSSALGAALTNPEKIIFCVIGDLAFFYDMNVLGNRHVHSNLRILLINNGKGTEFRNYNHPGAQFGEETDTFIAAADHFGVKSKNVVKHYAEDMGFVYLAASTKEEYKTKAKIFLNPDITKCPMILEVFTDCEDESNALRIIRNTLVDPDIKRKIELRNAVKFVVGEDRYRALKKLAKRK
ncbi:thiamine pyrophosphate-binding protein [Lachnospiraceae bacterium 48-21]